VDKPLDTIKVDKGEKPKESLAIKILKDAGRGSRGIRNIQTRFAPN
jgi:hypothetical protein